MRARLLVAGALLSSVLSGCHGDLHAEVVIAGLDFPAAFTVDPDNDAIWYAERSNGEIHRRDLSSGEDTLVWTVKRVVGNGLLGVALDPNYPSEPYLYVFVNRLVENAPRNQILKLTLSGGVGVHQISILNDPNDAGHNGGRILFSRAGYLLAVIGDHMNAANAQVIEGNTNLAGKLLRLTTAGGIPVGNPYPGSSIWASGIRNSFGFAVDPAQGNIWLTDNGPECNDEVNRIVKKGNYSWGVEAVCTSPPAPPQNTNRSGPLPQMQPQHWYGDSVGITGAAFCSRCGLDSKFDGRLLISSYVDGRFHRLTLNEARTAVVGDEVVYDHPNGVLSVETRPGQPVYFSDDSAIYKLTMVG